MRSESEKHRIVLDTKPLMKLFAQEDGWEEVQKILVRAEAGEVEAAISVVSLTEIYCRYLQEKRPDLAEARTDSLRYATYLKKLEIGEEVAVLAGKLKGKHAVSIADAFIAASAYQERSSIVSDDPDFNKITEVESHNEKDILSQLT